MEARAQGVTPTSTSLCGSLSRDMRPSSCRPRIRPARSPRRFARRRRRCACRPGRSRRGRRPRRIEQHEIREIAGRDEAAIARCRHSRPRGSTSSAPLPRALNSFLSRTYGPSTFAKLPKPRGCRPCDCPSLQTLANGHWISRSTSASAIPRATIPGALAARLREQVHQRLRRRRAAHLRDLRERLAGVVGVRAETVEDDVVGARHVREHEVGLRAVGEIPLRIQHAEVRLPVRVRVDVGGELHAGRARAIEHAQSACRPAPEIAHAELDVRHLHRHVVLAADRDQLRPAPPRTSGLRCGCD